MPTMLNADGQPVNARFNATKRTERDISEMLGLVKGVLSDGRITEDEASLLNNWVLAHPDVTAAWPGKILYQRLERIFDDGKVSEAERVDLQELLTELVGGKAGIVAGQNAATELPLDVPKPAIQFKKRTFVLTGKFAFGPRKACEQFVAQAGGQCESSVTQQTNYLVIGTFGSRDWVQTSHGRKIEKAMEYKQKGIPITIVGEDHWAESLPK
jgi:hypothetical protein